MNKLQRLSQSWYETKSTWETIFTKNLESTLDNENVMKRLYSKSDLAYICISTTGKAVSQVPLVVYKDSTGRNVPVGDKDPYQQRINKPNPYLDRYSFVEAIVSTLLLDGNVYVVPFPPGASVPVSLWVIRRKNMIPQYTDNGHIGAWKYKWGDSEKDSAPLKFEEVMPVFFWNPDDPFYGMDKGMPPSRAGEIAITSDYKAARYNQNFFTDGAVPAGVLSTDKILRDKTYERIKEQFEDRHKGYSKSSRVAVLEQNLKYAPIGITHKDMDFNALRKYNRQTVLQLYGMKESIISITGDVNRATAREQRKEWWEGTNLPIMKLIASAFQYGLMLNTNLKIAFDISLVEALHESFQEKVESAKELFRMGFTANEINTRLDLGFGEREWRDFWYQPINMVRVREDGTAELEDRGVTAIVPLLTDGSSTLHLGSGDETRGEGRWQAIVNRVEPIERQFEGKTKKLFFDMRKKTLALLFQEKRGVQDVLGELFEKERADLIRYSIPVHYSAMELGIGSVVEEVGQILFNLEADPLAIQYLGEKRNMIVKLVNTVKSGIINEIEEGLLKGESIEQIADRIRSIYNLAANRAMTIARTEVYGAVNYGRWMAIQRSGFKEEQWWMAGDEKVRDQHRPMHGRKKKVGENWVMPDGSTLRFPGDYKGPAATVINCRCMSFVVIPA